MTWRELFQEISQIPDENFDDEAMLFDVVYRPIKSIKPAEVTMYVYDYCDYATKEQIQKIYKFNEEQLKKHLAIEQGKYFIS